MARIWIEKIPSLDAKGHPVWKAITAHAHLELSNRPFSTLDPREVLFVNVCSFTFNFKSLYELDETLKFYQQKTHPSSRLSSSRLVKGTWGHWKSQRWYERLPMYLMEDPKRVRVVKALEEARRQWERKQKYA
jgi:hypothetical protein